MWPLIRWRQTLGSAVIQVIAQWVYHFSASLCVAPVDSPCSGFTFLFIPPSLFHIFPARLDFVTTQASQECLQMFSLWLSHTHSHTHSPTVSWTHFLSCTHKWRGADIVMTSGGSLYLTFVLKSLCSQQIQERLMAPIFMDFHKGWQKPLLHTPFNVTPCRVYHRHKFI